MECKIEITALSGVSAGDVFRFVVSEKNGVRIGRAPDCDLVLQDSTVSRQHAQIRLNPDGLFLSDLGSTHGTVHMGFQLKKGEGGARQLHADDEFKIGSQIFRVDFQEELFAKPTSAAAAGPTGTMVGRAYKPGLFDRLAGGNKKKARRLMIMSAAAVIALLALLLLSPEKKSGLPFQSKDLITPPRETVVGYWRGPKDLGGSDESHLDRAVFWLPSSDLVVDFDFAAEGETPIQILIDDVSIGELRPAPVWEHRQLIIRDRRLGKERNLIFDNPDYPARPGAASGSSPQSYRRWAVRNVRVQRLQPVEAADLADQLNAGLTAAESLDTTPMNLYKAIRVLQRGVLGILAEAFKDGIVYEIPIESSCPPAVEVKERMVQIISERRAGVTQEASLRHLNALIELVGRLDAELWRRVSSRLNAAELSAGAKNHIDAYDSLNSIMSMFPDDTDFRFILARRMFDDTKIVPKNVKKNPGKFRKRKAGG